MPNVEIRALERLTAADLKRVAAGYTSRQAYAVHKTETPEHTSISLDLRDLETPFVKTFERPRTLLGYYRGVLRQGLSYGAYDGARLVGLAVADRQDWNGALLLLEFHVAPSHRRQGIGRRLMDAVAAEATREYMRVISAETQNTNVPAIHFYRKVGFTLDAIDLSLYGNDDLARGEVAVFMKRRL